MQSLYGPTGIYTTPTRDRTDSEILGLLSETDEALSFDTIKFCLRISKEKAYKRLHKLARWGQVRLVTKRKTSFWKAVEEGE